MFKSLLGLVVLASALGAWAAGPPRLTQLSAKLWMAEGQGGNVTIAAGPQGTLLIDAELEDAAPALREAVAQLGLPAPRWVLNTHFHYDHTGGNALFAAGGASLIATPALVERLRTPQRLWRAEHAARPREAWPVLALVGELRLQTGEETVRLLPLPGGHTDGDAIAIFEAAQVAAVGDLLFAGMFPIVHPEHGGGLLALRDRLGWLRAQLPSGARLVPGHGPLMTRAELDAYLAMIDASLAHVRAARAAGKTLAQLQAEPLPTICEPFSHGYRTPAQWLATLWEAQP